MKLEFKTTNLSSNQVRVGRKLIEFLKSFQRAMELITLLEEGANILQEEYKYSIELQKFTHLYQCHKKHNILKECFDHYAKVNKELEPIYFDTLSRLNCLQQDYDGVSNLMDLVLEHKKESNIACLNDILKCHFNEDYSPYCGTLDENNVKMWIKDIEEILWRFYWEKCRVEISEREIEVQMIKAARECFWWINQAIEYVVRFGSEQLMHGLDSFAFMEVVVIKTRCLLKAFVLIRKMLFLSPKQELICEEMDNLRQRLNVHSPEIWKHVLVIAQQSSIIGYFSIILEVCTMRCLFFASRFDSTWKKILFHRDIVICGRLLKEKTKDALIEDNYQKLLMQYFENMDKIHKHIQENNLQNVYFERDSMGKWTLREPVGTPMEMSTTLRELIKTQHCLSIPVFNHLPTLERLRKVIKY